MIKGYSVLILRIVYMETEGQLSSTKGFIFD